MVLGGITFHDIAACARRWWSPDMARSWANTE